MYFIKIKNNFSYLLTFKRSGSVILAKKFAFKFENEYFIFTIALIMLFPLSFLTLIFTIIIVILFNLNNHNCNAQSILERFRQNSSIQPSSPLVNDEQVKFVSGTKVKLLPLQLGGTASLLQPIQPIYNYVRPHYVYYPYFRQNFLTGWPYYHPVPVRSFLRNENKGSNHKKSLKTKII